MEPRWDQAFPLVWERKRSGRFFLGPQRCPTELDTSSRPFRDGHGREPIASVDRRVGPRARSRRAPSSPRAVQRPIPASIGGARSRDHSHTTPSPRVPNSTHAHTHTHARTALARVSGEGQFAVRARTRSHTLRLTACEQTPDRPTWQWWFPSSQREEARQPAPRQRR